MKNYTATFYGREKHSIGTLGKISRFTDIKVKANSVQNARFKIYAGFDSVDNLTISTTIDLNK